MIFEGGNLDDFRGDFCEDFAIEDGFFLLSSEDF